MVNWVITILRMRIVFCLFSFFRILDREFLLIFRITYRGGMIIIVPSKRKMCIRDRLKGFNPTGNNSVYRELSGFSTTDGRVEHGTIDQASLIVAFHRIVTFRDLSLIHSCPVPEYFDQLKLNGPGLSEKAFK